MAIVLARGPQSPRRNGGANRTHGISFDRLRLAFASSAEASESRVSVRLYIITRCVNSVESGFVRRPFARKGRAPGQLVAAQTAIQLDDRQTEYGDKPNSANGRAASSPDDGGDGSPRAWAGPPVIPPWPCSRTANVTLGESAWRAIPWPISAYDRSRDVKSDKLEKMRGGCR